jgi:hypothetical protein
MVSHHPTITHIVERLLEGVYGIIASPASAVILALLLVGLVVSEVVTVIVSLSVFSAWLVFVVTIARTDVVKGLPVLRRLGLVAVFACIAGLCSHIYVEWILSSYARHHHDAQQQSIAPPNNVDEDLVKRLRQLFAEQTTAITRMRVPGPVPQRAFEDDVPKRWKIKGNKFSEMPTEILVNAAKALAQTMRQDKADTDKKWLDQRHKYDGLDRSASTDGDRRELQTEWQMTEAAVNGDLQSHFIFFYRPDAMLLLRAMELRAPPGTVEPWALESYELRANQANVGEIYDLSKDLERVATSIERSTPQLEQSPLLRP